MSRVLFFTLINIFVYYLSPINAWDLSYLGINDDFQLLDVSLYYTKAFLCIRTKDNTKPTLVESTWPENLLPIPPTFFRISEDVEINEKSDVCANIIQAKSTSVDDVGRLWVLDIGNENCQPKILAYNLIKRNTEIFRMQLTDKDIASMDIYIPDKDDEPYKLFLTSNNGNFLHIIDIITKDVHKLNVLTGNFYHFQPFNVKSIAFSRHKQIYLSDNYGNLALMDLNSINLAEVIAKPLGSLLGEPKSLRIDANGYLYYILQKFGAIVRWDSNSPLNAENHEILEFHPESVAQIVFGVRGSVWIVFENMLENRDHCIRVLIHFTILTELNI